MSDPPAQQIWCECGKTIVCGAKITQCACGHWYGPYGELLHRYTVEVHRVWRLPVAETNRRYARSMGAALFDGRGLADEQYVVVRRHAEHVRGDEQNLRKDR
jgi:hypothetical protein